MNVSAAIRQIKNRWMRLSSFQMKNMNAGNAIAATAHRGKTGSMLSPRLFMGHRVKAPQKLLVQHVGG